MMTDDEIEALAKKHIAPHADRLANIRKDWPPYQQTEQFRRVKAFVRDVEAKLRAPVADERAFQFLESEAAKLDAQLRPSGAVVRDIAKRMRAALASAPVAPQSCPTDVCQAAKSDGVLCANDECDRASGVRLASAHVADERELPTLPVAWGSAINDSGDGHVDLYSAEQMQEYARAALASTPSAGQQPIVHQHGFAADNQRLRAINESLDKQLEEVMTERDNREDVIDKLLDIVLGADRSEWSSEYGYGHAVIEVEERMHALASAPVAGEARTPPGYRVKVVEGHGYRITSPSGSAWVAHSDTPAGDLIAALLAAPQAIKPGYALVPIEPTKEMLTAAFELFELAVPGYATGNDARRAIYKAMVGAAK